jgi:hypothetical protein
MTTSLKIEVEAVRNETEIPMEMNMTYKSADEWLKAKSPESYELRKKKSELKTQKAKESLPAYANKNFSLLI